MPKHQKKGIELVMLRSRQITVVAVVLSMPLAARWNVHACRFFRSPRSSGCAALSFHVSDQTKMSSAPMQRMRKMAEIWNMSMYCCWKTPTQSAMPPRKARKICSIPAQARKSEPTMSHMKRKMKMTDTGLKDVPQAVLPVSQRQHVDRRVARRARRGLLRARRGRARRVHPVVESVAHVVDKSRVGVLEVGVAQPRRRRRVLGPRVSRAPPRAVSALFERRRRQQFLGDIGRCGATVEEALGPLINRGERAVAPVVRARPARRDA